MGDTVKNQAIGKAELKEGCTSKFKESLLNFRKMEKGKFRLFFQVKGNEKENYDKVTGDKDNKETYGDLLKKNKYPLDLGENDYYVPLAIGQSKKKNKRLEPSDIKVSPVFPLSFSEAEINEKTKKNRLSHLRSGYLYVFMDGFLWREFKVLGVKYNGWTEEFMLPPSLENWKFYDINLASYQGQNKRKEMGSSSAQVGTIVIPYEVAGKANKIQMCFSEVQWTWEYICKLGGMDKENDPRYIKELHQNKPYSEVKPDQNLIKSRLQEIKLSGWTGENKSAQDIRKNYLLPLSQAFEENRNYSAESKKLFPAGRDVLEYLIPSRANQASMLLRLEGSKNYIKSCLPAVVLYDPIAVAENLRHRFLYIYNEISTREKVQGKGVKIGRYASAILKNEEIKEQAKQDQEEVNPELEVALNVTSRTLPVLGGVRSLHNLSKPEEKKDPLTTITYQEMDKRIEEHEKRMEKLSDKLDKAAEILIKYLSKELLIEKVNKKNTVAAAFRDYHIADAYTDKTKRGIALEGFQRWMDLIAMLGVTEAGEKLFDEQLNYNDLGSTAGTKENKETITLTMLNVLMCEQLMKEIEREKKGTGINPFASMEKYKKIFSDKYNGKRISEEEYTSDILKGAAKFYGSYKKVLSGVTTFSKLFAKSITRIATSKTQRAGTGYTPEFRWDKYSSYLHKVYGISADIKTLTMAQWHDIVFKNEIVVGSADEYRRIQSDKLIKQRIRAGKITVKYLRPLMWGTKLDNWDVRLTKNVDKANSYLDKFTPPYSVVLLFQLIDVKMKYDALRKEKVHDSYYIIKSTELIFTSLTYITTAASKVSAWRGARLAERSRLALQSRELIMGIGVTDKTLSDQAAKAMKLAQILGKAASVLNLAGEITGFIANEDLISQMEADNNKELAAYYKFQRISKGLGIIGAGLLVAEMMFAGAIVAAAGVATGALILAAIPVIGWIVLIAGVLLWLFGPSKNVLTPKQEWLKHCYWGVAKYRNENTRNKSKQVYLNYSEWKEDITKELDEIHKIMNSYEVHAWWYLKKHEVRARGNRGPGLGSMPSIDSPVVERYEKALVVDIVIPDWVEDKSSVGILITGIPRIVKNGEKKVIILGSNKANHPNDKFVDGRIKPIHMLDKPKKNELQTVSYHSNNSCLSCHAPLPTIIEKKKNQCSTCHTSSNNNAHSSHSTKCLSCHAPLPSALERTRNQCLSCYNSPGKQKKAEKGKKQTAGSAQRTKTVRVYVDGKDVDPEIYDNLEIIVKYAPMGDGKVVPSEKGTILPIKLPKSMWSSIFPDIYIHSVLKLYDYQRNNLVKDSITVTSGQVDSGAVIEKLVS